MDEEQEEEEEENREPYYSRKEGKEGDEEKKKKKSKYPQGYAKDGFSTVFVPNSRFEREMKRKIEKDQWAERWHPVRRPSSTMKVGYMKPEFDKR